MLKLCTGRSHSDINNESGREFAGYNKWLLLAGSGRVPSPDSSQKDLTLCDLFSENF